MRARRPYVRLAGMTLLLPILAAGPASCAAEGAGERVPLGHVEDGVPSLEPALQAQLDAGNAAFRARDYETALAHYTAAVQHDGELAAGWYGVALAQGALGDSAARAAAMAEVERLAPEIGLHHP